MLFKSELAGHISFMQGESIEPGHADLVELKRLLGFGTTPYVEAMLRAEIAKVQEKIGEKETPVAQPAPSKPAGPKIVYEAIDSYAFSDASDKAKIIVRNVQGLSEAKIDFAPTERSFAIAIHREGLPNLKLTVSPLYKKILPGSSEYTVRKETLTILLDKKKKTSWMKLKKGALDAKKPKIGGGDKKKEDPNTALMDMMKKMYDEGDDEMKRTISKAMWEAQHKKDEDKDKEKDKMKDW
jgi:calcyclin binding protein